MKRDTAAILAPPVLALFMLLLCREAAAQDVHAERHVYGTEAPAAQILDAHILTREQPSPVLVHVVSGGWTSKPPQQTVAGQYRAYHDFGYSVVAVCHRTIDDKVSWPAPQEDLTRAIQFIRLHADEWNIDADRIAIAGRSSGGHVAMMVAFGADQADPNSADPVCRQSSAVRCVIQQGGPTNLSVHIQALLNDEEFMAQRGQYIKSRIQALLDMKSEDIGSDECIQRLSEISPINFVSETTVPVLMIYTGPEGVTSLDDPRLKWQVHTPIAGLTLANKLKSLGVDHEIVIGQDLGRGSQRRMKAQQAFLEKYNRS